MRITNEMLNAQVNLLNKYTNRTDGEKYYVFYENGYTNLAREHGSGRATISYGNTKGELSKQLSTVNAILSIEEERRKE